MHQRNLLVAATCAATVLALTGATTATGANITSAAPSSGSADFNGDGYPDLVISAHTATVAGIDSAGMLTVQYGSPTGFGKATFITRDTPGIPGAPEKGDDFGRVIGHGDVDGDGYDDLVVNASPMASSGNTQNHSGSLVLRGSKEGLTGRFTSFLSGGPLSTRIPHRFSADAIADVTGDGIADVLSRGVKDGKAGLLVFKGPLDRATNEPASVSFQPFEEMGSYGSAFLYTEDMTGDGITDVVALSYGKGVLLKGSASGLSPAGPVRGWESGAFGDLNKDGYKDFVSGDAGAFNTADGGRIHVTYGGPKGVSTTIAPATYTQDSPGVPGLSETGDRWGRAVAVGDTNGDGYADIVIGAPFETGSDEEAPNSGAITILRGSAKGVTSTGAQSFSQNSKGVPSTSERKDLFGSQLSVIDSDRDGKPEVYVGGYGEDGLRGRVWKFLTTTSGVTGTGSTSFNLTTLGGPAGKSRFGQYFGG
ncbi:FG-GAP-like repeat-containing protein [Streptomyces sp. NPDC006879]|uniref:FG-GAP-like repeat-containing protein n=1 Tax=Streptomyces sp. NPDC006879 TaxID=3364767 RepID=UPI0036C03815